MTRWRDPLVLVAIIAVVIGTVITAVIPPGSLLHLLFPSLSQQKPTADNLSISTISNAPTQITLSGISPIPDDKLTFFVVTSPSHGKAVPTPGSDSGVTYTPNTGYSGYDSFTYRSTDKKGANSNIASVSITVNTQPTLKQNQQFPTFTFRDHYTGKMIQVPVTLSFAECHVNPLGHSFCVTDPNGFVLAFGDIPSSLDADPQQVIQGYAPELGHLITSMSKVQNSAIYTYKVPYPTPPSYFNGVAIVEGRTLYYIEYNIHSLSDPVRKAEIQQMILYLRS